MMVSLQCAVDSVDPFATGCSVADEFALNLQNFEDGPGWSRMVLEESTRHGDTIHGPSCSSGLRCSQGSA
jgi:hypothetical protein